MHDLSVIERKNQEALERDVSAQLAAGKWVVATYTGVTLYSTDVFDTQGEAEVAFAAPRSSPDINRKLLHRDATVQGVVLEAKLGVA